MAQKHSKDTITTTHSDQGMDGVNASEYEYHTPIFSTISTQTHG